jgi:hypothetical protein
LDRPNSVRTILICFCLALSSEILATCSHKAPAPLVQLIKASNDDSPNDRTLIEAAIDASPGTASQVASFLKDGNESQRSAALVALAYMGGETALAALQRYYNRTNDTQAKTLLCFALAARGSGEDRALLMRSLAGEHIGDEWPPIVSSALSPGVLRAREATGALKTTAAKEEGSIASHAASEALRWIEHGKWDVEREPSASQTDRAVAAVFINGVPRTEEATAFFEEERGRIWVLQNGTWKFRRGARPEGTPSITFNVHFNPQNTRALVSVGLTFGPLNGAGYDYLLRRDGDVWKVDGVLFTWIS